LDALEDFETQQKSLEFDIKNARHLIYIK